MARMHSGAKGKAGSHKPIKKEIVSWLSYKESEIESLIVKFAKQGKSSSEIGLILRDTYGIPDVKTILKKSITIILKEKKIAKKVPEDLTALIKKDIALVKHLELNKKDEVARRGLLLVESSIGRLSKYYIREGRLPSEWKFERDKAKLLLE